ncbi:MAG: hypothetical protein FGM42_01045, partial [Ilumatobacteraceae bacterium]|nr:hypothetical protein [Ilumatobacteraceae bacterium]
MSTQKMALRLWTLTALLFSFVLGPMVGPVTGVSADASEAPVAAAGLAGRLSLGDAFTCAVVEGRVFCWGDNQSGQTAQLLLNQNKTPVEVPG